MIKILLENQLIEYRNESTQKPPNQVIIVQNQSADEILKSAYNNVATVWRGDFHQAKQVLSAMKKRIKNKNLSSKNSKNKNLNDLSNLDKFNYYRLMQSQNSRLFNSLLIEIKENFVLELNRAPNIVQALSDVYGEPNSQPFLLPLNQLLGFIGAYEWHQKGVEIQELDNQKIYVPFGVFSPIRGEYLSLMMLPKLSQNNIINQDIKEIKAVDMGTGSGVLAAILAKRGVNKIWAIDNNPRAIACARKNLDNLSKLNVFNQANQNTQINIIEQDLFNSDLKQQLKQEQIDLLVCNPPWLPAKPTSAIETALYDPNYQMLKGFLSQAHEYLNPNGQGRVWLIMSDLAEYLGLRDKDYLNQLFNQYNWGVEEIFHTNPKHAKAHDSDDFLAFARNQEKTYLYVLYYKLF